MINIWNMRAKFSTDMRFTGVNEAGGPPISVTHFVCMDSPVSRTAGIYGGHMGERPAVAAKLVLELDDFDLDFFTWGGTMFVSEHMRNVMALDPSEIRFFEIDDSEVAPLPQSKNYMIMEPMVMEDVFDVEKSEYAPMLDIEENLFGPSRIYFLVLQPDFAATHDLFYDRFFAMKLLCTEQFARRILEADCTGMDFRDPSGRGYGKSLLYRTRRGIEHHVGYDKITNSEIMELVQPIP